MHQRIGIIGGLSAESTVSYYLEITRGYLARFGDCGYPEIVIYSVNLEQYHRWRDLDRWDLISTDLIQAAGALRRAGADFALIASNTMHKVFEAVERAAGMPMLHILDPTLRGIQAAGLDTVGLLGTRFTMRETFYRDRLERGGVHALVPGAGEQEAIHRIIVEELVHGRFQEASRSRFQASIDALGRRGAQGIILGCTEIPLLIGPADASLPLFDSAALHARAALERALAGPEAEGGRA